jgi:hypothetical protein
VARPLTVRRYILLGGSMRKIVISFGVAVAAIAAALAGAGTAAASGTPQSPQSETFLVSCPNMAPFVATSPTPPSRVATGQTVAVIPQGIFYGRQPASLYMTCSLTVLPSGPTFNDIPILIAPTSGTSH